MLRRVYFLLCATLVAGATMSQEGEISFTSTELAQGLYMLEGEGGFAGGNSR